MATQIHPTAVVDPTAELDEGVHVGAYAVIGPRVEIGADTHIGANAQVRGPARIGRANRLFPMSAIGFEPQDLKFDGEEVFLEVGDRNQFREFCTVHRGTGSGGGMTRIGNDNLFMAYAHVAHDCFVGDRTVFVNNATLAGHIEVGDDATIGAFSSVHQFCRVGRHAYIGGYSVVTMDALPFVKTVGQKPLCYGLNSIGLKRKGFAPETVAELGKAVKIFIRSGLNSSQALEKIVEELGGNPEVDYFVNFVRDAERGVIRATPGRRGGRGGGSDGVSGGVRSGEGEAE